MPSDPWLLLGPCASRNVGLCCSFPSVLPPVVNPRPAETHRLPGGREVLASVEERRSHIILPAAVGSAVELREAGTFPRGHRTGAGTQLHGAEARVPSALPSPGQQAVQESLAPCRRRRLLIKRRQSLAGCAFSMGWPWHPGAALGCRDSECGSQKNVRHQVRASHGVC